MSAAGLSLPELLVVVTLVGLALAFVLPSFGSIHSEVRLAAGARQMVSILHAQRWKSLSLNRYHGLFFDRDASGWRWFEVEDGNGNGLSTAEVRDGTDPKKSGPHRLGDLAPATTLGYPTLGRVARIPPRRGWIDTDSDPIRFGVSNLVAFSPRGSSSTGTLFVTDGGRGLMAIVLYGRTGRLRVWRWHRRENQWSL